MKYIECPRCMGKGIVDLEDIKRIGAEGVWGVGDCAYCRGRVDKSRLSMFDPYDLSMTTMEGFGSVSIVNLNENGLEFNLDSLAEFIDFFKERVCDHYIFRGVSNFDYHLISKIGRTLKNIGDPKKFLRQEKTLLELFKSKATAHTGMQQLTNWQWLVLAQHYGLSTRLLDWTENPLVALYFCSLGNIENRGALYLWHFSEAINISETNPFEVESSGFFVPPYLTNRIVAQSSIFSISAMPWKELKDDFSGEVMKIGISKDFKIELRNLLPRLGINQRTIFSDLDSYAKDIDSLFETKLCRSGSDFGMMHSQ